MSSEHTSESQSDSHAWVQVPDLHLLPINRSEYRRAVWGPSDGVYGPLHGGEAQHRGQAVLLPQLDGPVRGAAQEHTRAERRPLDVVHRTLRASKMWHGVNVRKPGGAFTESQSRRTVLHYKLKHINTTQLYLQSSLLYYLQIMYFFIHPCFFWLLKTLRWLMFTDLFNTGFLLSAGRPVCRYKSHHISTWPWLPWETEKWTAAERDRSWPFASEIKTDQRTTL